jgi:hypothetical protein
MSIRSLALLALLLLAVGGCGGNPSTPPDAGPVDAGSDGGSTASIIVELDSDLGALSPYIFGASLAPHTDAAGFQRSQEAGFKLLGTSVNMPAPADPADPSGYDFSALDAQVQGILDAGAEPIVTFAPNAPPNDLTSSGVFVANIARHLTQLRAGAAVTPGR